MLELSAPPVAALESMLPADRCERSQGEPLSDVPAAVTMHGAKSGIHEKSSMRILKQEDLDKLWETHREVKGHTSAEELVVEWLRATIDA